MNARIQELAYDAEDYADGIVDQGGEFHQAYTQKLAELIVKECIQAVDNVGGYNEEFHMNAIKAHFGVEE